MKHLKIEDLKKVIGGSGDRNGDGPKVARVAYASPPPPIEITEP
jgi:hypothetical protein